MSSPSFASLSAFIKTNSFAHLAEAVATRFSAPKTGPVPFTRETLTEFARHDPDFASVVSGQFCHSGLSNKLDALSAERQALSWQTWAATWGEMRALPEFKRGVAASRILTAQAAFIGAGYVAGSLLPVCAPTGLLGGAVAWVASNKILHAALSRPAVQKALMPSLSDEDRTLATKYVLGDGCASLLATGATKIMTLVASIPLSLGVQANVYGNILFSGDHNPGFVVPGTLISAAVLGFTGWTHLLNGGGEAMQGLIRKHGERNQTVAQRNRELRDEISGINAALSTRGALRILDQFPGVRRSYLEKVVLPKMTVCLAVLRQSRESLEKIVSGEDSAVALQLKEIRRVEVALLAEMARCESQLELLKGVRSDATIDTVPANVRRGLGLMRAEDLSAARRAVADADQPWH